MTWQLGSCAGLSGGLNVGLATSQARIVDQVLSSWHGGALVPMPILAWQTHTAQAVFVRACCFFSMVMDGATGSK